MPLDTSNSQSDRTKRIKCKAIAGGRVQNSAMPLSNEQAVSESTFVDFKLGRMPYIVQPASGGPAITDEGCCSAAPTQNCYLCNVLFEAVLVTIADYNSIGALLGITMPPIPDGYTNNTIVRIYMSSCNQSLDIEQLDITVYSSSNPPVPYTNITFDPSETGIIRNITPLSPIPPPFTSLDFFFIFPSTAITYDESDVGISAVGTVTGTVQTCGLPIISISGDGGGGGSGP